ncbi:LysR family transcriptional regulator [Selenomonas montiformis]|uniref:LysR family transcriptional regulator n=1 Tax=Selenomonas montiformis TaxID=2652285 RepID=UPI0039F4D347
MLLKQLQYFMAVAECRHFTKAAERLFVSQSALSQQITKLENDIGVKLINRVSHPIELTPAGKDFAKYSSTVLADLDMLEQKMQAWRPKESSTLRIGMITGLGRIPLAEILAKFNGMHSETRLSLTTHLSKELCRLLNEDAIDLAIFATLNDMARYDFDVLSLQQEPFVAILPICHPCAEKEVFDLSKATNENFIFPTPENVSHDIFLAECRRHGFQPKIASYCNSPGRRIELVQAGIGISLISESGLSYYPQRDGIMIRPLREPIYKHIVIARQKNRRAFPALQAFWNYIQKYAVS